MKEIGLEAFITQVPTETEDILSSKDIRKNTRKKALIIKINYLSLQPDC